MDDNSNLTVANAEALNNGKPCEATQQEEICPFLEL